VGPAKLQRITPRKTPKLQPYRTRPYAPFMKRESRAFEPELTLPADRLPVEYVTWRLRCGFRPKLPAIEGRLLAQAKTFNNIAVPIRVAAVEIVQQPPAFVNHHNQTAT